MKLTNLNMGDIMEYCMMAAAAIGLIVLSTAMVNAGSSAMKQKALAAKTERLIEEARKEEERKRLEDLEVIDQIRKDIHRIRTESCLTKESNPPPANYMPTYEEMLCQVNKALRHQEKLKAFIEGKIAEGKGKEPF